MPLDIGEVLSDTFAVIGRTFVVLANVAVLFVGVPAAIRIAGLALAPVSPLFALVGVTGAVATWVGMLFAYGCIFQLAMQDLHGQSISTDAMVATATRKFWPLLGLALLMGLAVLAGAVLLVVPGVMLLLAWSVTFPALVLEDRGVFAAFRRSADLTRGKRWSIFLLLFLVTLVVMVIELVLFAIFGGFHGLLAPRQSLTAVALMTLLSVVTAPFGAVLNTALFNQLRGKAGVGAEEVAEVFA
jgi:hypothetical protein